jgi:hypothetical protein
MAKQVVQRLVDDLDGSAATQTVSFGIDGRLQDIDLNDQHAQDLRAALEPFVAAGRRVQRDGGRAGRSAGGAPVDGDRNPAIRQWALDEGVQLPTRGRIAAGVQAAYDARDVAALYAATGLEYEPEPEPEPEPASPRSRGRIPGATFSAAE